MATVSIAVSLPDKKKADGYSPYWMSLVGFGREAEALLRLRKGDAVHASGRAQLQTWTDRGGSAHTDVELILNTVIAARAIGPAA